MEVRCLASGQILTTLDQDVFDGKTAREVKQTLAAHVGVSRFRQRLFTEDGFQEIHDDEVFGSATVQVQLVVLEFLPSDVEEENHMIDALRRNDWARVEQFLQGPRNPNLSGGHGSKHVKTVYTPESLKIMWVPWGFFSCDLSQKPKRPRWDDPPKRGTACGNVDCWCVEPAWLSV